MAYGPNAATFGGIQAGACVAFFPGLGGRGAMYRAALLASSILACVIATMTHAEYQPSVATIDANFLGQGAEDQIKREPLVAFVAKGAPNSCGPGCDRWIAIEGAFDRGSAERVGKFLESRPDLPVHLHSSGGLVQEAIALGRRLRKLRGTIRIARTAINQCAGHASKPDCRRAIDSGDHLSASLRPAEGLCLSACVYAFVGASTRSAGSGARLGVHESKIFQVEKGGAFLDIKTLSPLELKRLQERSQGNLREYLTEMGIDPELIEIASKTNYKSLNLLSNTELERYGITTSRNYETPWLVRDDLPTKYVVTKVLTRRSPLLANEYRTTTISLYCYVDIGISLTVERELATGEHSHEPSIRIISDNRVVWESKGNSNPNPRIDFRFEPVTAEMIERSAPRNSLEYTEHYNSGQWSGKRYSAKLSLAGLVEALRDIQFYCHGKK